MTPERASEHRAMIARCTKVIDDWIVDHPESVTSVIKILEECPGSSILNMCALVALYQSIMKATDRGITVELEITERIQDE